MRNFLLALIIIIAVAGGAYYVLTQNPTVPDSGTTTSTSGEAPDDSMSGTSGTSSVPMIAAVSYDGAAFSPQEVTIKKGGTVTWTSSVPTMEVASAQHPTHIVYDGTARSAHCASGAASSFDQCAEGTTYSFTFDKVGMWAYHDHENASAFGKVIVVE